MGHQAEELLEEGVFISYFILWKFKLVCEELAV
jgi:hypothetical protein